MIDIYQDWSGPCQSVRNLFKKIKEELNDQKLYFAAANVDKIDTLDKYRGRSEPYFLLYGVRKVESFYLRGNLWSESSRVLTVLPFELLFMIC